MVLRLGFLASSPDAALFTGGPIALGPVAWVREALAPASSDICKFSLCRVLPSEEIAPPCCDFVIFTFNVDSPGFFETSWLVVALSLCKVEPGCLLLAFCCILCLVEFVYFVVCVILLV